MTYGTYRARLALKGPISAPWQADTIFGHICWTVRDLWGEAALDELLAECRAGTPPFTVSDAFPADFLPKLEVAEELFDRVCSPSERASLPAKLEWLSRRSLLPLPAFESLRRGEPFDLDPRTIGREPALMPVRCERRTIDRFAGKFDASIPGSRNVFVPAPPSEDDGVRGTSAGAASEHPVYSIYVKAGRDWPEKIETCFKTMAIGGMGGGASVGMGRFELLAMERFCFAPIEKANGFVSLSHFTPARSDPTEGSYRLSIKRGRIGRPLSGASPFKRPVFMLTPGSCFRTDSQPSEIYGRAVENISDSNPAVMQMCFAFALPIRLPWWGELGRVARGTAG